ncbi:metallophosphoesterase [Arthrobacter sp. GMC3]|uniref:metallophosphoesterase n=1 Tax=Arthrobacter sp. GMC3 TaxID=2058894 RepID=UPI000CE30DB4|nr:metallophosphoesterase [Arthrobacter sp. GMC3]
MSALRILHLSDTHLLGTDALHSGLVDTVAAYKFTLSAFENAGPLDLVVVSGDVSDDGSPASYEVLRSLTGDFAARHGAQAIYAMGNHDERAGFRHVLGNGHPNSGVQGLAVDEGVQGPIVGVSEVAGYRIITLDSSVPGRTHGFLESAQLDWLRTVLASKSSLGSVLVIHHPPVPPVTALHQGIELINSPALAEVLRDSDVLAILSGHYHHHLTDSLWTGSDTIPVVVTSGVVNSNDALAPAGHERAIAGTGGTLITVSAMESPANGTVGRARIRTMPINRALPQEISPAVVFDLGPDTVVDISAKIAATDADRLLAASTHTPKSSRPTLKD